MKLIKSLMIGMRNIINKSGESLDKFNRKVFFETLGMSKFLVSNFLLDYVVKVPLFNKKSYTFSFTRSAILLFNTLGIAIVSRAIYEVDYNESYLILQNICLGLFAVFAYLSFFVTRNVELKYIVEHGDFTQIVGLNQFILDGKSKYDLNNETGEKFVRLLGESTDKWNREIENSNHYNSLLVVFHPIVLVVIYLAILIPLTYDS